MSDELYECYARAIIKWYDGATHADEVPRATFRL